MFTELPFLDRFAAAADAGFSAVEYLFPYDYSPADIAARLKKYDLTQALFNLPPGDWEAGERGIAALAGRSEELRAGVETGIRYSEATGVQRLHLMAGLAGSRGPVARQTYRDNVAWTAARLAKVNLQVVLEPINSRNMPGYFLNSFDDAAALIGDLDLPNLKLQFDLYHCQIMHGDVTMRLRALMPMIGHVQTASVPSRHEPRSEEMNDDFLFAELDRLGYAGFVGCEYHPRAGTSEGLGWFEPYRASQRQQRSGR
jgi:hydroxypyruvate isomerase